MLSVALVAAVQWIAIKHTKVIVLLDFQSHSMLVLLFLKLCLIAM